ncbi:ATPase, F1/V1/A1 complex, alpha/beta subunit [Tanacetum coccineum]|uniref:ATPase, F1/V1/A1 complex, alpha/beta subunit n=1 Tax=Tanacetum coccineum TaxID=301880 RepID=A0ABQ5FXQ7_9ASTR
MRTKRDPKIPQNLGDYVHSINTTKSKNKKSVSKKNGISDVNLNVGNHSNKGNGGVVAENGEGENGYTDRRKNVGDGSGKEGFEGDLNGRQFPPINGFDVNENENNKEEKECLDSNSNSKNGNGFSKDHVVIVEEGEVSSDNGHKMVNTDVIEEMVEKSVVGSQTWGSGSDGKKLADIIKGNKLDNKLINVPTEDCGNGDGIVIFDDEIIELGSQKWNLTVCGQFIGCSMGFNEARYHIRRMWYRYGIKEVISENGIFYFKFQDEEGINEVINNGPWMVNNKPLVVQKWSIDMCMDKTEPKRIPVWVKLRNVPMEAWSVKGISALASSIGKPVIMDEVTTKMCVTGVGRLGFARILVEIDAEKGIKDKIEVLYKSKNVSEGTKKIVNVEYSWIPCICSHCKVFGHTDRLCRYQRNVGKDDAYVKNMDNEFKAVQNKRNGRDGLYMNRNTNMQNDNFYKKGNDKRNIRGNTNWQGNNRFEYRERKENGVKDKRLEEKGIDGNDVGKNKNMEQSSDEVRNVKEMNNNKENQEGNGNGILGSNRFTLLNSLVNEEDLVPNIEQRKVVDEFLSKEKEGSHGKINKWTEEMKRYYRDRKELFNATIEIEENEDVMEDEFDQCNSVLGNEVEGMGGTILK